MSSVCHLLLLFYQVVLADGRVATCTQNKTIIESGGIRETRNNGELFWALRGGGGCTFGVVVHYMLKLYRAPTSAVYARFRFSYNHNDDLKTFLEANDKWMRTAPSHWGNFIAINNQPTIVEVPLTHNITYQNRAFAVKYKLGPWDENVEFELKPFYDLQDLQPKVYVENKLANYSSVWQPLYFPTPRHIRIFSTGAAITPEKHNGSLWDFLVTEITSPSDGFKGCSTLRLGGKTSEYDETTSSVHTGIRRAQGYVLCSFTAPGDHATRSLEIQKDQQTFITQFTSKLRRFGDGDSVNSGFLPSPDWKMVFWGKHYVDLLVVKIRYDPDNLFSCYHCVGSDRKDMDDIFESSRASDTITGHFSTLLFLLFTTVINMY